MASDQFTALLAPGAEAASVPASKTIFLLANPINLMRICFLLMLWIAIICLISVVYEIWRLETTRRAAIKLMVTGAVPW